MHCGYSEPNMNYDTPSFPNQQDHLETLLKLGQLLNSSLDLKVVLDTAMSQVVHFVGAERGFNLLVEIETGRVWGEAVHEIDRIALERTLSQHDSLNGAEISRTIVEYVLDHRRPVLTHNAMEDARFKMQKSVKLANLRSVLCVPLTVQQRLLGIIYVDNRVASGLFLDAHLAMLTAFANQAAVAIENARLYQNLRRSLDDTLKLQDRLQSEETKRLALEEAIRLKSDFVGYVAHELRNPLTAIRGYVQTLLSDDEEALSRDIQIEFYEAIEADSDRLLDLINELLDVSKLESGKPLTAIFKEINLQQMAEKLVRRHRFYRYYTERHNLRLEYDDDAPKLLVADEDKLNQMLSNLLSNAIKYSPEGGEVLLKVYTEVDVSNFIVIEVTDHGVGLEAPEIDRLFTQYERVEREDIRMIPGTGLGLYLVRCLAELHGGHVSCTSEKGKKTSFALKLPLLQAPGLLSNTAAVLRGA